MNILSRIRDIRPRVKYMMSRIRDNRPMSVNESTKEPQCACALNRVAYLHVCLMQCATFMYMCSYSSWLLDYCTHKKWLVKQSYTVL